METLRQKMEAFPLALYEKESLQLTQHDRTRAYVYGGRGVGKTPFLTAICNAKQFHAGGHIERVSGRDWLEARSLLRKVAEDLKGGVDACHLVIDHLDYYCQQGLLNEGEDFYGDLENIDVISKKLWSERKRLAASGTVKPGDLLDLKHIGYNKKLPHWWVAFWSDLLINWEHIRLDPWHYGWQTKQRNLFEDLFHAKLSGTLAERWREAVLALTGGHPSLLIPSISELDRLVSSTHELSPIEQQLVHPDLSLEPEELESLIRRHLEDYLVQTGLKRIRRAISALRDADQPDYSASFHYLVRLARDEEITPPYEVREILTDHALVYKDKKTGAYRIPGDMIRREILRDQVSPAAPPEVILKIDPELPHDQGQLIAKIGLERLHVRLSGSP